MLPARFCWVRAPELSASGQGVHNTGKSSEIQTDKLRLKLSYNCNQRYGLKEVTGYPVCDIPL